MVWGISRVYPGFFAAFLAEFEPSALRTKDVCVTAEMCHPQKPEVTVFYEPDTHTVCSVVRDPNSYKVAVVDSATWAIELNMG